MTECDLIVAHCGLVCSDCGAFEKEKCQGCHSDKPMCYNCKVKKCNLEHGYTTCADCTEFEDLTKCKKLNSFVSKIFKLIFRSNRLGNLNSIRQKGLDTFIENY